MFLNREEREKFALWCEREAKSNDDIASQLAKMVTNGVENMLAKQMKQRAMAYSIVALELRKIEDMTV